jgi:GH15 family glucan-1,4-alpha-glucosidase
MCPSSSSTPQLESAGCRIQDYAVIGNGRSAALVSRGGSLDWLCWPRFESPSLFAAILDPAIGGHWKISPTVPARSTRRYVDASNVLVTEFETPDGLLRLTDLMPVFSEEEKKHVLVPEHEVLRIVECIRGEGEIEVRFEPRPNYARREPRLRSARGLGIRVEDGPHLYTLRSDVSLEIQHHATVVGRARLSAGERRHFSLTYDAHGPAVLPPLGTHSEEAIRRTTAWWRQWASRCTYDGPYREQVIRSLLILKLLAYAPSGAIVAAPTTSLPERIGGDLNWDYRFCWIRDASLTVHELLDLGYPDEAAAFVGWLLHVTRLTRPRIQVLYDVYGELPRSEELLAHLEGHRGSRPVRIRNAATGQLQLDTYGEVIDAVAQMCRRGASLDLETQRMLRQFGQYACENWQRPDQGIWEPRTAPQHHTHSRVLCWTALDRLLELHQMGVLPRIPTAKFEENRRLIRRDVEDRSWNSSLQTYTQVQGGSTVDATLLLLGWYGFANPSDPRMRATFQRIRERLEVAPGLLYRVEESRAAGEGAFGICGFWAAEYLARGGGSLDEAEAWFERLLCYGNDVGIHAEEIDPSTGEPLGNVPQAFTHVGLISAALAIEERRSATTKVGSLDQKTPPIERRESEVHR